MCYVYYIESYWGLNIYLRSYVIIKLDQMKCPDTSLIMFNRFYYMESLSYLLVDSFHPEITTMTARLSWTDDFTTDEK